MRKMRNLKRWAIANKIYLLLIGIIAFVAYIDTRQIVTFFTLNTEKAWELYNTHTLPAFVILWIAMMAIPAIIYYWFTRDHSDAWGIFGAGVIMLATGLEDIFYFMWSRQPMTACMQWFNDLNAPVSYWSKYVFNEACVSPVALVSFAILGLFLACWYFQFMKRFDRRKRGKSEWIAYFKTK